MNNIKATYFYLTFLLSFVFMCTLHLMTIAIGKAFGFFNSINLACSKNLETLRSNLINYDKDE